LTLRAAAARRGNIYQKTALISDLHRMLEQAVRLTRWERGGI
jgi:hypothetical protein